MARQTEKERKDVADLAARIKADRIRRRMSWPEYAEFMGVKQSTLYKIADGRTTRPHDTTVADIEDKLKRPVKDKQQPTPAAAHGEVVPGR